LSLPHPKQWLLGSFVTVCPGRLGMVRDCN
jgi:hypothetical protein